MNHLRHHVIHTERGLTKPCYGHNRACSRPVDACWRLFKTVLCFGRLFDLCQCLALVCLFARCWGNREAFEFGLRWNGPNLADSKPYSPNWTQPCLTRERGFLATSNKTFRLTACTTVQRAAKTAKRAGRGVVGPVDHTHSLPLFVSPIDPAI